MVRIPLERDVRKLPRLGQLGQGRTFNTIASRLAAFRQGLAEQGYVEEQNVEILLRRAEGHYDSLPSLADDLVRRAVAVIFVTSAVAALAAAKATPTIPIVFFSGADPVESGLVASLNRPGGNVTGASFLTVALVAKRLELLHEIVPAATSIGYLQNPANPLDETQWREADNAARVLGLRLVLFNASTPAEIESAFAVLVGERVGALLVAGDPVLSSRSKQLADLTARHKVPAIFEGREAVEFGGLMNYGPNRAEPARIAGTYVGRILKGENPADLPAQLSTRIEMVLNLKTAKALGIEVPTATLLRATEVIEADR
jgi:putative ABC transport system substrate-binding protein